MTVNAPRRRRRRRRARMRYNAPRRYYRRRRRRYNAPAANMPRRYRRRRRNQPARVPRTFQQFFSAQFMTDVAMASLGAITPSWITDRLLPMVGLDLRTMPLTRRLVQLAIPTAILMVMPRGFGRQTGSFAIGAYAVTGVGLINDLTGGMVGALSAYEVAAPVSGLGRYEFSAPGLGLSQEDEAELLYAG